MSQKKRGLSRGLNALLADTGLINIHNNVNNNTSTKVVEQKSSIIDRTDPLKNLVNYLKLDLLVPGQFQPRQSIPQEELTELVESIKTQGVLQPLIVRKTLAENYEIIAGERRWRAANLAGLTEIPVIIKNVNDRDALTIALIENIQRENLNPIDEAIALDRLAKEFSLTHNEIASAIGKPRTSVTNLLRILNLPKEIKVMIENQQLDLGHAKVLLGAPLNLQIQLANKIIEGNLSVRATEQLLAKFQQLPLNLTNNKNKATIDPDLKKLQKQLSDTLGAKVIIITKPRGRGKLTISYNSLEELEGILERMAVTVN